MKLVLYEVLMLVRERGPKSKTTRQSWSYKGPRAYGIYVRVYNGYVVGMGRGVEERYLGLQRGKRMETDHFRSVR